MKWKTTLKDKELVMGNCTASVSHFEETLKCVNKTCGNIC